MQIGNNKKWVLNPMSWVVCQFPLLYHAHQRSLSLNLCDIAIRLLQSMKLSNCNYISPGYLLFMLIKAELTLYLRKAIFSRAIEFPSISTFRCLSDSLPYLIGGYWNTHLLPGVFTWTICQSWAYYNMEKMCTSIQRLVITSVSLNKNQ